MQIAALKSVTTYRDLLRAWTLRILRARYQQSVLGILWAIVQPAAQVLIFTIIFTQFVPIRTGDDAYILFSSVAMVPWTFFANSLLDMVNSLVENMNLVTKVYFPREILPLSSLLARFVDFLIASVFLGVLMLLLGGDVSPQGLLFVPAIILAQIALALGLGLIGAALNVFYRDIKHFFTLGIELWKYATPVFYPLTTVDQAPEWLRQLYFLNPMVGIIQSYRDVLLNGSLPGRGLLYSVIVGAAVLAFGYWFFKRMEFQFADVV